MFVRQILKTKGSDVFLVRSETSIAEVARLLRRHRIGAVVVTDRRGRLAGIVSERDLAYGLDVQGVKLLDLRTENLMTRRPVTCSPDDRIEAVMQRMTDQRCRHLPVLAGGRLVGVISIGDIVKARLDELQSEAAALQAYISGAETERAKTLARP